jgi:predicted metal-binding membrane protein
MTKLTLALDSLLRRERVIVAGALGALTVLSWTYFIWLSSATSGSMPDMPGMAMSQSLHPWTAVELSIGFAMWSTMMIGMMTPSIAPGILMYARLEFTQNEPLAPTGWFVGGYLLAWLGFAFIATITQAALLEAGAMTPTLRSSSGLLSGTVFILAGGYQLSMLKNTCLTICRSPTSFIHAQGGYTSGISSALKLGLKHGVYCVGCCWSLMALLFVVGVMDLVWMAVLSIWVLLEKIFPRPGVMTRLSGFALLITGIIFLARA